MKRKLKNSSRSLFGAYSRFLSFDANPLLSKVYEFASNKKKRQNRSKIDWAGIFQFPLMKRWLIGLCLFSTCALFSDSLNLFNDSQYTLKAVVYNAKGVLMGEFTLNPRDSTQWSSDFQNYASENTYASQSPYTVDWFCMSGSSFGTCNYAAAGATVTAKGCGGPQQCQKEKTTPSTEGESANE